LWLGAHPSAPARLVPDGLALGGLIARDPVAELGADVVARFGPRLPFLLKVLAAEQPLSLQAHPDLAQAAEGYAAEEAAGVARDAPERTYVDSNHKPELLVAAWGDFDALCGFRCPAESARLLAALEVPALQPTVQALRVPDRSQALQAAVRGLLALPGADRERMVADLAGAAALRAGADPVYRMAVELAERYPGDAGTVVAMLLNLVRLARDEAVWMPAGNLHAYLRGTGVEIMAASDNVLRCGLTPKHVNVPELLRVLRFDVLDDPVVRPEQIAPGVVTWPVPAVDFTLHRARAGGAPVTLSGGGPRVLLGTGGVARLDDAVTTLTLPAGRAVFVGAGHGPVEVRAAVDGEEAEIYQAGLPANPL